MENDLSFEGKYIELIRIYYTHIFCRVFFFFFRMNILISNSKNSKKLWNIFVIRKKNCLSRRDGIMV